MHGMSDLFWLFLIITSLQPILKQRMLLAARMRAMRALEQKRGSRVITLIHRQERMSFLGFPVVKYIDIQDSEEILRAIKLTDDDVPLDLILHTPGGLVLAAEQIAHAVKAHPARTTVFVPHYAMSGGTMIALAADEIVMDPNAVLGPVDPQLGQHAAASIVRTVEAKGAEKCDDETVMLADAANMALQQVRRFVTELLEDRMGPEKAEKLADTLSQGWFTHDYTFLPEQARELGLDVSTDMPKEVYDLMELFPQPVRQMPTVEYVPVPYRKTGKGQ